MQIKAALTSILNRHDAVRSLSEAYRHVHPKKRFPDEEGKKKQMVRVLQEAGRSEEDFNPNFEDGRSL